MWKIISLFFGAQDLTETIDPLNPNELKRAGFSAARNIIINGDTLLKLPTQFSMIGANKSPLSYDGKKLYDSIRNKYITASDYNLAIPAEITNLLPTASGTVGVMAFSGCNLFDIGKPCEFCTVGATVGKTKLNSNTIVKELKQLIATGYNPKNVTINTGQLQKYGADLELVGQMAQVLNSNFPKLPIAAEIGPFSFLNKEITMKILQRYGLDIIDTFMINVELIRDSARKQLSPGKPLLEDYLYVIKGLSNLGYKVSSVVQLNFYPEMQDEKDYLMFFQKLAEVGKGKVVPELLISRAVPGSRLKDSYWRLLKKNNISSLNLMVERFIDFGERLNKITDAYNRYAFDVSEFKAGCVSCGMCNLNKEIYKDYKK